MKPHRNTPLLHSLKEKRRYVVFEAHSPDSLNYSEVQTAISNKAAELFGTIGLAHAGISFLPDWNKNKGIVRVAADSLDLIKSTFVFIKEINNKHLMLSSVGISGTLNKARNKFHA